MAEVLRPFTIEDVARKLRSRQISASELTDECLRRIDAANPTLNAFILVMADEARRQAREADRELSTGHDRGPLHGVPVSIKDLIDILGTPTTAASRVREGHVAGDDAPVVARLREAGAVLIGKTNLHEFAFGTTNEESAFGPARNPHDSSRSPGGSSGGSAISVTTGMAVASLGTDTGGSIRIPAAACGIVGFKPTYGEVSAESVVPLSRTLDHVGPITASVTSAWIVYSALLGRHSPPALSPTPLEHVRLGVPRAYFFDVVDVEVRTRFEEAVGALRGAGADVAEVEMGHTAAISAIYLGIQASEASAYHASTIESIPERYTVPVRLRLEMGRYILAEDYLRALRGQDVLRREVDASLHGCDALILPTLPIPAPPLGAESMIVDGAKHLVRPLTLRLTQLFNVSGHPAISVPCGLTSEGLPCGFQLVGRHHRSEHLLGVALACETQLGTRFATPATG